MLHMLVIRRIFVWDCVNQWCARLTGPQRKKKTEPMLWKRSVTFSFDFINYVKVQVFYFCMRSCSEREWARSLMKTNRWNVFAFAIGALTTHYVIPRCYQRAASTYRRYQLLQQITKVGSGREPPEYEFKCICLSLCACVCDFFAVVVSCMHWRLQTISARICVQTCFNITLPTASSQYIHFAQSCFHDHLIRFAVSNSIFTS